MNHVSKPYLIRSESLRFSGPHEVRHLKELAKRGRLRRSDEICGHLGPWVPLVNRDRLKRRYPEIEALLSAAQVEWLRADQPILSRVSLARRRQGRRHILVMLLFVFLLAGLIFFLNQKL